MAIIRFDPFGEFAAARGPWIPAVDIFETDAHDVIIKAELPDMTREDIEVTVENDTLTLNGYATFACMAGDRETLRRVLARLGSAADLGFGLQFVSPDACMEMARGER